MVAFVAPLLLPLIAAVATKSLAVSLWSIGSMTLLPVVLLSSPYADIPRAALRRILGIVIAVPLMALIASPVVAMMTHRHSYREARGLLSSGRAGRVSRHGAERPTNRSGSMRAMTI